MQDIAATRTELARTYDALADNATEPRVTRLQVCDPPRQVLVGADLAEPPGVGRHATGVTAFAKAAVRDRAHAVRYAYLQGLVRD